MDTGLIWTLLFCWSLAALLYYVVIVRQERDLGGWGISSLFALIFVITPILLMALWSQKGAEDRLLEIGFKPHPSFDSSIGIAAGVGENPTWIFSTTAAEGVLIDYYKDRENRGTWRVSSENEGGLLFEKGRQRMTLFVGGGNVVFSLQPGG